MSTTLHRVLVYLLLLAIPLQGLAAASMAGCAPDHHDHGGWANTAVTAAANTATLAHPQRGHTHQVDTVHPHHAAASVVDVALEAMSDVDADADAVMDADIAASATCSACASCCVSVALPTAAFEFAFEPPAAAAHARLPTVMVGFVTGGPQRPPRISYS